METAKALTFVKKWNDEFNQWHFPEIASTAVQNRAFYGGGGAAKGHKMIFAVPLTRPLARAILFRRRERDSTETFS